MISAVAEGVSGWMRMQWAAGIRTMTRSVLVLIFSFVYTPSSAYDNKSKCLDELAIFEKVYTQQRKVLSELDFILKNTNENERRSAIEMHRAKQVLRQQFLAKMLSDNHDACAASR